MNKRKWKLLSTVTVCLLFMIGGCSLIEQTEYGKSSRETVLLSQIPQYNGHPYVEINDNEPSFTQEEKETQSFETYGELDSLGRCTTAFANLSTELMPTQERESIGQIKPSGWQTVRYDNVDGKYLYNRCHLIGFQLSGENANERNLITGTRYMNVEGMLPFENMVADYIKETSNHVLYRVTPIFKDDELVARGVQMEAWSLEDEGESISFNVYVYNVQPGIEINYADGTSHEASPSSSQEEQGVIRGNRRSKIYHCPGQAAYEDMADSKYLIVFDSEEEAQKAGYRKAQR